MDGYRESIWPEVFAAPRISEILMAFWLLTLSARRTLWKAPWPGRKPELT
jgi:hypothetical protein